MKFKCLIVDDEPLARKLIAGHVSKIESLEVTGECGDAMAAGNFLRAKKVDIIFLDIQLPEVSGLQFIRTLKNPPAIILTTAFRDYAPEAFELDAADYLLKPISFERFSMAVNRFFDRQVEKTSTHPLATAEQFIYLKADRKTHKVPLAEILFFESLDDHVDVTLVSGRLTTHEQISIFEKRLPHELFLRIHRSFIVNIRHISSISSDGIGIAGRQLPFGRAFKKSALSRLSIRSSEA